MRDLLLQVCVWEGRGDAARLSARCAQVTDKCAGLESVRKHETNYDDAARSCFLSCLMISNYKSYLCTTWSGNLYAVEITPRP